MAVAAARHIPPSSTRKNSLQQRCLFCFAGNHRPFVWSPAFRRSRPAKAGTPCNFPRRPKNDGVLECARQSAASTPLWSCPKRQTHSLLILSISIRSTASTEELQTPQRGHLRPLNEGSAPRPTSASLNRMVVGFVIPDIRNSILQTRTVPSKNGFPPEYWSTFRVVTLPISRSASRVRNA